jgi:hypothetical protein
MTVSLPAPVQALFDATNAGDTTAFLDAFTADGVVDDWDREFRGRDPSHFTFRVEDDRVSRTSIRA